MRSVTAISSLCVKRNPPLNSAKFLVQIQSQRKAHGRSYYVKGGSNPTGVSEEVRDLIRNQRTSENIADWKIGHGIQKPIVVDMQMKEDIDDTRTPNIQYWPHKGEEFDVNFEASPIFLVKRVKNIKGQPWWHRETMGKLGFFPYCPYEKVAVVPNTPKFCLRLYSVKHLIEIIPLKFPKGYPSYEDFDPSCCRVNHKGEFYYHEKLKVDDEVKQEDDPVKLTQHEADRTALLNWNRGSPTAFGNFNYARDTTFVNPEMLAHEGEFVRKFGEDKRKGTEYEDVCIDNFPRRHGG